MAELGGGTGTSVGKGKGATIVLDSGVNVEDNPEFVNRCRRTVNSLHKRVGGAISIKFFSRASERSLLRAQLAWRNEVFETLYSAIRYPDLIGLGSRGCLFGERVALRELESKLRRHLEDILRVEERVNHARAALNRLGR